RTIRVVGDADDETGGLGAPGAVPLHDGAVLLLEDRADVGHAALGIVSSEPEDQQIAPTPGDLRANVLGLLGLEARRGQPDHRQGVPDDPWPTALHHHAVPSYAPPPRRAHLDRVRSVRELEDGDLVRGLLRAGVDAPWGLVVDDHVEEAAMRRRLVPELEAGDPISRRRRDGPEA